MWPGVTERPVPDWVAFKLCRFLQLRKGVRVLLIATVETLRVVRFVAVAVAVAVAKELAVRQALADWVGQVAGLLERPPEISLSLPRVRTGLVESTSWAAAAAVQVQALLSMELQETMVV